MPTSDYRCSECGAAAFDMDERGRCRICQPAPDDAPTTSERDEDDMHYHVTHNIPGYMPEGDTFTTEDVREALAVLADELERSADSIQESGTCEESDEDAAPFYNEAERVFGMAEILAWASTNPTDRFDLESDGTVIMVEDVATGGLSVGIDHMPDSEHSLGLNFHLTVCDEEECEDDDA